MPIRITQTTQEYLINASLPEQTDSYTVISHKAIIDKTKEVLDKKGFLIERELYKCSQGAQIAQGIYHLRYGTDTDISMMFAWSNSYDKTTKFKCSIGAYVHNSLSSILSSNIAKFKRKHTGTADQEAFEMITGQIESADVYYNQLISDKEQMKLISITDIDRAKFIGVLYLVNELLTSEQLAIVKSEFKKPSFMYNGLQDSVWIMYNAIIYALQKSHPKTWMDQQSMVHYLICKEFGITPGIVQVVNTSENEEPNIVVLGKNDPDTLPGEINLLQMIEEVKAEKENGPGLNGTSFTIELNKNAFPTTIEEVKLDSERTVINGESPVSETIPHVTLADDDMSWVCLGCGHTQGSMDLFHEGQLCTECFNAKNS